MPLTFSVQLAVPRRPMTACCGCAVAILEANRHLRTFRGGYQRLPRHRLRIARRLLVAGHHHCHVHRLQRAGGLQRPQRLHHDDVAALHVQHTGPLRRGRAEPLELLERAVRLEHGVEVTDQQHARTGAGMVRHEMAGPLERRAVDPAGLEPERLELRREQPADLAHAVQVHACRC